MTSSKFIFHSFMCVGSVLLIFFICWDLLLLYELIVNSIIKFLNIINEPFTIGILTVYFIFTGLGITKEY
jgi:hypothetical protein|nr:MAG TPA: hypothetical protein [Caudoviricetes sp.]